MMKIKRIYNINYDLIIIIVVFNYTNANVTFNTVNFETCDHFINQLRCPYFAGGRSSSL